MSSTRARGRVGRRRFEADDSESDNGRRVSSSPRRRFTRRPRPRSPLLISRVEPSQLRRAVSGADLSFFSVAGRLRSPPPPPRPASSPVRPAQDATELAMRLLKRMRPDELMAIGKAANELAKKKVEDSKKIVAFASKFDNFVEIIEDCYICLEPLLDNIGTTKFGVVSWKCRCTVPQKAHSRCVFSKICHAASGRGTCDMCNSPMEFEKTTKKGTQATIRFSRDETDSADASRVDHSSNSNTEEDEDEGGGRRGSGRRGRFRLMPSGGHLEEEEEEDDEE